MSAPSKWPAAPWEVGSIVHGNPKRIGTAGVVYAGDIEIHAEGPGAADIVLLIAAAPDLYEALTMALDAMQAGKLPGNTRAGDEAEAAAEIALAKARGEAA